MSSNQVIELNDKLLISQGRNRRCYQHPEFSNRCIKVLHDDSPLKTQQRETRYFTRLTRRGVSWEMVVPLLDEVETNLGDGVVFELLRDVDGKISRTLEYYIYQDKPELNNWIITEIEHLKQYLFDQNIVFRDLNPLNILVQKYQPDSLRLMVIDGIGHNDYIPLCDFSKTYGRQKIKRTWNRKLKYWFGGYDKIFDSIKPY